MLAFGWLGFNGGSTLYGHWLKPGIVLNTVLAMSAGGITTIFICIFLGRGLVSIERSLNGMLAGLVAITAGCAVVGPTSAIIMGAIGAVICYTAESFLVNQCKLDDPVGAIAVHGFSGA